MLIFAQQVHYHLLFSLWTGAIDRVSSMKVDQNEIIGLPSTKDPINEPPHGGINSTAKAFETPTLLGFQIEKIL
jgi:hypothetical protein